MRCQILHEIALALRARLRKVRESFISCREKREESDRENTDASITESYVNKLIWKRLYLKNKKNLGAVRMINDVC